MSDSDDSSKLPPCPCPFVKGQTVGLVDQNKQQVSLTFFYLFIKISDPTRLLFKNGTPRGGGWVCGSDSPPRGRAIREAIFRAGGGRGVLTP